MEDILSALEASTSRLYSEKKFKEVEEMYSTFIKESQEQSRFVQIVSNQTLSNWGNNWKVVDKASSTRPSPKPSQS